MLYQNLRRLFTASRVRTAGLDAFMLRLRIATIVLVVYWLALFTATHVPGGLHDTRHLLPTDKIAHLTGYTLLALLLAWTVLGREQITIRRAVVLWAIVATYGIFDEITQGFVPRRSPDPKDWIADAIGAVLGLALFGFCAAHISRRLQSEQKNAAQN